jgi:ADP-heptose:LPS heptosyltransferase
LEGYRGIMFMKIAAYFKNGIGNLIMMIPALKAYKEFFAPTKLHIFIDKNVDEATNWPISRKEAIIDILKHLSFIDEIIEWPDQKIDPNSYKQWYATPHGEQGPARDLFRGYGAFDDVNLQDWFYRKEHEVEHYLLTLLDRFGWVGEIPQMEFPIADKPELKKNGTIHIALSNSHFPSDVWQKRRWPYYPALARILKYYYGAEIHCIGGEGDEWWISEMPDFIINHIGRLSFRETGKLLSQCDLLVTIDTSALHIASALKIPTLALFGPSSSAKNGPWRNKKSRVLKADISCAGCRQRGRELWECKEVYPAACMRLITPDKVMETIRGMLR